MDILENDTSHGYNNMYMPARQHIIFSELDTIDGCQMNDQVE